MLATLTSGTGGDGRSARPPPFQPLARVVSGRECMRLGAHGLRTPCARICAACKAGRCARGPPQRAGTCAGNSVRSVGGPVTELGDGQDAGTSSRSNCFPCAQPRRPDVHRRHLRVRTSRRMAGWPESGRLLFAVRALSYSMMPCDLRLCKSLCNSQRWHESLRAGPARRV